MDTLIGLLVDADVYNRSNSVIYMGTPGTSCPLPSPFKNDNKSKPKKQNDKDEDEDSETLKEKAYKRIVKKVVTVISLNASGKVPEDSLLNEAASSIWNITRDLKELTDVNSTNDIQFYKMKVDGLQNITDQFLIHNGETPTLIWRRYLTTLFDGIANITLDLDNKDYIYIPVEELAYFPEIAFYLLKVPDLVLELYMWWVTVYAMILSTTSEMTEFIAKESVPFTQVSVYRTRSLDCASLVINFMGLAVSYGIADKQFLNNTKPKVEHMLNDIKDAFVERVDGLNWMDKETKKVTLEKSKEMISFIGFPEWLLDRVVLEDYYNNITMQDDTFLENMMGMIKTSTPTKLATLRQESERTWRTDPTTVNAYNYFSDNSITVPMAILTHPFYNLGLEVLNYGAIGSVLGHELTHGFDNIGRKFDKWGNYQQWWSNQTIETFENKTQCFVDQYENFTVSSVEKHIDGKQTLAENLADNGGLHHAFLAYRNYVKKHGDEPKLPGFESFSNTQMFFIAFGSIWCETPNTAALKYQIEHDEHCPSSVRVLGTLQNSHEFAEAFKCPVGSIMNPNKTRCRIW
ncbi:hypothetical protein ILUMI_04622 [Ignelater luminosus]|uniref:Endothelin-converting enzyme 1 n=1 Tax=Ignelater luminosus TaxID=2038154 RepID=A0A8K0D8L8_IGNLU|nr:hypothetical protein ILUMI_04622 [Ignelater luminosus]